MDYEIRGAQPEEVVPACRMMWKSYSNHLANDPEDFFEPFQTYDPHWKCDQLRILWKDGKMASTVRVFMREVYDGENYLLMGGIGSVATHPDFRRQGLCTLLLEDSIKYMQSMGVDYSSLYAGPIAVYEKSGFHVEQRIVYKGQVKGSKCDLEYGDDIAQAKDIYANSNTRLPGAFKRSDEYWNTWVKSLRMKGGGIVYSRDADAYVIFTKDQSGYVILDAASAGPAGSLANLIVSAFPGEQVAVWDIAQSHPIISALESAQNEIYYPGCVENERKPMRSFMVRRLSDRKLPESFNETCVDHF